MREIMAGSNEPKNKKYAYLRQLSMDKLLELLFVAPVPTASPEDEAYVDALEEAIIEKENESPSGFLPDVNQQWAEFQKHYSVTEESPIPDVEALIEDTSSADQENVSPRIASKCPARSRRIWRTALTAAALAVLILGCMVAAQAAGVDVFGAMARWTESTFSLGTVRSQGAKEVPSEGSAPVQIITPTEELEYSSLQEVLDANEVTEVIAPTWLPEEYALDLVDVTHLADPELLLVYAEYTDGTDTLQISIMSYTDEPSGQIEKNDKPPETFEIGGITFYLIENAKNYTVAWYTDHYECYICGALNQKETLKKMVYSMYD